MFKYTKEALSMLKEDFKRYLRSFKIASLIFTSAYFVYALISQTGIFVINIVLATLFVLYTTFELITINKNIKFARKIIKRTYKWTKICIRAVTLGSMLYGIYTATTNVSAISTIIATLMIIMWVFQILLEIIVEIVENKIDLLDKAFKQDIEDVKRTALKPVTAVANTFKRLAGKEIESEPEKHKKILKLEKRIQEKKEKLEKLKQSKKEVVDKD